MTSSSSTVQFSFDFGFISEFELRNLHDSLLTHGLPLIWWYWCVHYTYMMFRRCGVRIVPSLKLLPFHDPWADMSVVSTLSRLLSIFAPEMHRIIQPRTHPKCSTSENLNITIRNEIRAARILHWLSNWNDYIAFVYFICFLCSFSRLSAVIVSLYRPTAA